MAISQRKGQILFMQTIFQLPFHSQGEGADLNFIYHWLEGQPAPVSEDFAPFLDHQEEIDQIIDSILVGWGIHRLAKVDLAVIRLASYGILYCPEIPTKVGVSEAIELAKKFSTGDSSHFINGILGPVIEKCEDRIENKGYQ